MQESESSKEIEMQNQEVVQKEIKKEDHKEEEKASEPPPEKNKYDFFEKK